ncbi:MAG TPA: hypothetical protein VEQ10_14285 [Vicinamibacteria bacterium]|nr:hypothetical protein [Vicinamibacteria bacterium]
MPHAPRRPRRSPWRPTAAAALPLLLAVWALWTEVFVLEAGGLVHLGGQRANLEWAVLSCLSAATVGLFWAASRALRVLAYTVWALVVSVGLGVAGMLGVVHAFGGPEGNLAAPAWALVALAVVALLCVLSLLATAALIVEDVRAGDEEDLAPELR